MYRISSMFFMISLLVYYIPKVLKMKKGKYLNLHIITGWIAIIAMVIATIFKFGQADLMKYVIFTIIMLSIGVTGYLTNKISLRYKATHIGSMFMFFVYLALIIIF